MKTSKKIIIPFFSTVVGLSLAAGIGGAFAWYQYNSQATASFLGTSVADTGVLQVGWKTMEDTDHDSSTPDVEVMHWGRDFVQTGAAANLVPVTFGQMGENNALPQKAYAYPEAGCGSGYEGRWVEAKKGEQYAQFEIYLRALAPKEGAEGNSEKQIPAGYELVERNVFISDWVCKSLTNNKVADDALRIHLGTVSQGNRLLAKKAYSAGSELNLYGPLDLDNSGEADKAIKTAFKDLEDYGTWDDDGDPSTPEVNYQEGQTIIYGHQGDKQVTEALDDIKQIRDTTTGKMPESSDPNFAKKILTTSSLDSVKMTVTIWLEGWEYLQTAASAESQIWNPNYSADTDVQVGLQFDTGIFRGDDL